MDQSPEVGASGSARARARARDGGMASVEGGAPPRTGFLLADEDVPVLEIESPHIGSSPAADGASVPRSSGSSAALRHQRGPHSFEQSRAPWYPSDHSEGEGSESSDREWSSRRSARGAQRAQSFVLNQAFDDERLSQDSADVHVAELIVGVVASRDNDADVDAGQYPHGASESSVFESFFDLTHARLLHIFEMFDQLSTAKAHGIIDYDNFRRSLRDAGLDIKDKAGFDRLVKKVDMDRDGGITFNEFETVVQSLKLAHMFRQHQRRSHPQGPGLGQGQGQGQGQGHGQGGYVGYQGWRRSFLCINYNAARAQEEVVDLAALKSFMYQRRPPWATHRWIDLAMPCVFDLKCLAIKHRLHPLALEDCLNDDPKARAKLDRYDTHVFVSFPVLSLVYGDDDLGQGQGQGQGQGGPSVMVHDPEAGGGGQEPQGGGGAVRRHRSIGGGGGAGGGRYGALRHADSDAREPLIRGKRRLQPHASTSASSQAPAPGLRAVGVPRVLKHNAYFFIGRPDFKTVISVMPADCRSVFRRVRRELCVSYSRLRAHDGMYLLYTQLDTLVDSYGPLVEELEAIVEALSQEMRDKRTNVVSGAAEQDFSAAYHDMIKELNNLRRWMAPAQRVVSNLILEEFLDADCKVYLRDVHDHLDSITDDINSILNNLDALKGEHDHSIEVRLSSSMSVLTVVATASLPGQFLASVFGMNFDNLPGLHAIWGYYAFWVVTIASWVFLYLYFRRKGFV